MKLHIELCEGLEEPEVIIRCGRVDETVQKLGQLISETSAGLPRIVYFKDAEEYYLAFGEVLFFETEGEAVYAHTAADAYRVKLRLYELEAVLPRTFTRASKSAIINTERIYAVDRSLGSSGLALFMGTHKKVYISRHYNARVTEVLKGRTRK